MDRPITCPGPSGHRLGQEQARRPETISMQESHSNWRGLGARINAERPAETPGTSGAGSCAAPTVRNAVSPGQHDLVEGDGLIRLPVRNRGDHDGPLVTEPFTRDSRQLVRERPRRSAGSCPMRGG